MPDAPAVSRLAALEALAIDLAASDPIGASEVDGTLYCALCNGDEYDTGGHGPIAARVRVAHQGLPLHERVAHEPSCPWVRARVLVGPGGT